MQTFFALCLYCCFGHVCLFVFRLMQTPLTRRQQCVAIRKGRTLYIVYIYIEDKLTRHSSIQRILLLFFSHIEIYMEWFECYYMYIYLY